MNIIIEHKTYDFDLRKILPKELCKRTSKGWKTEFLGYSNYNQNITFILPKTFDEYEFLDFLNESRIFTDFELSWPVTVYKVLKKYAKKNQDQTQLYFTNTHEIISSFNVKSDYTLIDTIFNLLNVHKNNPYIYFKEYEYNKKSNKKQSWKKTIKKEFPLIENDSIIYPETINNNSIISFEDLLLKIYYSTLHKISVDLNINIELNENIPIVKNHQMKIFEKKILKILKQIKGNYFSDLHKKIHYFLTQYYNFFGTNSNKKLNNEFLLTSNFELIFEDMVDELISDMESVKLLKYHNDGKVLDHIYYDSSILPGLNQYNSFYIGDSKYYTDVNDLHKSTKSIFKQYTYALNVLNQCINPEKNSPISKFLVDKKLLLVDKKNRSYHPIVNFFILPNNNDSLISIIEQTNSPIYNFSYHYRERAFDRSTHVILYFKINLQKLLNLYLGIGNVNEKRKKIKKFIRESAVAQYKELYKFKKIHPINTKKIKEKDGLLFSYNGVNILCQNKTYNRNIQHESGEVRHPKRAYQYSRKTRCSNFNG